MLLNRLNKIQNALHRLFYHNHRQPSAIPLVIKMISAIFLCLIQYHGIDDDEYDPEEHTDSNARYCANPCHPQFTTGISIVLSLKSLRSDSNFQQWRIYIEESGPLPHTDQNIFNFMSFLGRGILTKHRVGCPS